MNLYEAIKDRKNYLKESLIQWYTFQLLKAIEFTHKNGIFHRDIKPENILLKDYHLVLADLGSCKGIKARQPYTEYVSTRWYRAPECIMTNGYYNYKMDIWGVGCVLFEMATLFPLFPGDNEIDQMIRIQNILGPPSEDVINLYKANSFDKDNQTSLNINIKGKGFEKYLSHCNELFIDLLKKLLVYNPDERLSAKQALQHIYFQDITDNKYYNQYFIGNYQKNSRFRFGPISTVCTTTTHAWLMAPSPYTSCTSRRLPSWLTSELRFCTPHAFSQLSMQASLFAC